MPIPLDYSEIFSLTVFDGESVELSIEEQYPIELAIPDQVVIIGGNATGSTGIATSPISGLVGNTVQQILEELAIAALPKEVDFTDSSLSVLGVFPYTHNLNTLHPTIEVWDSTGARASPDDVTIVNANSIGVKMATYRPLSGIFHLKVSK